MTRRTPFLVLGGLLLLLVAVEVFQPREYDERLRAERVGAEPFDAEMLYRLLPGWLDAPVEPRGETPFVVLEDTTLRNTLYLFLTDSFEPDEAEADRLVDYVERGNTVLMVAEDFGGPFSWALSTESTRERNRRQQALYDSLAALPEDAMEPVYDEGGFDQDGLDRDGYDRDGLDPDGYDRNGAYHERPNVEAPADEDLDYDLVATDGLDTETWSFFGDSRLSASDTLTLEDPALGGAFVFSIRLNASGLIGIDSSRTSVLGRNEAGQPTFVRVGVGEGAVLVASTPLAFTNAALSTGQGADYLAGVFGYVPDVDLVIWDDHYKPLRAEAGRLNVIARTPPLQLALALILTGGGLFLFFRGRRWQRPIPVVVPPPNAQREFARTVGRLHFVRGDRGWLARRKARLFEDHVRTRLGLPDADLSDATARRAAVRAGLAEDEALALFRRLRNLRADPAPEPGRLVAADQDIDAFFARATASRDARLADASPVASPADAPTA